MNRIDRCAICGNEIGRKRSIDHVFPKALYKWSKSYLPFSDFEKLKKLIENDTNLVPAHISCNQKKEETIPCIDALFIDDAQKKSLKCLEESLAPVIAEYTQNKAILQYRQKNRCYCCGGPIMGDGVLRRIDPKVGRKWENACLVCHSCNMFFPDFRSISINISNSVFLETLLMNVKKMD